jgi:quercetin dioxygenase-like cupin family protein
MPSPEQAQAERKAAAFERTQLTDEVLMARVTLTQGQTSGLHYHTRTRDTFYVLKGVLTVAVAAWQQPQPARWDSRGRTPQRRQVGERAFDVLDLTPGDVLVLEPGTIHAAANELEEPVEFLCMEGVGAYDFIAVAPEGWRPSPR